jgi:hypothetical protein
MTQLIKITFLIICTILFSCDEELLFKKKEEKKDIVSDCKPVFNFNKLNYTFKDPIIVNLFDSINAIEELITSKESKIVEKSDNKASSFKEYKKGEKTIKIVSDIYVKDLDLSSSKHEIYFLNDCNILAKMTKFAYRSKRIKAVYFFLITNHEYVSCIVSQHHSIFHKKDKWVNISKEKLAMNWSNRIFNNIIRPHLK